MKIPIQRLPHLGNIPLPFYATTGAVGMDLVAAISTQIGLYAGTRKLIPTGIAISVPPGYEAQIRPRSGLAVKYGISIPNSPGTIDQDYRGEIKVLLYSTFPELVPIDPGMRIAQLVIAPVQRIQWDEVEDLEKTLRGKGGFGSTGE